MTYVLPEFIYAGTGKAGTTWLFATLAKHPEVFLTPVKETNFFDLNFERGPDWYASFFEGAAPTQKVGEIAHRYLRTPMTAKRIQDTLGKIKILVGLREPADYVLSDYLFARRSGDTKAKPEDYIRNEFGWDAIDYTVLLQAYLDVFGAENILICDFAELGKDPQAYLDKVTDFIGVARFSLSEEATQKVNPARKARSKFLSSAASKTSKWLKKRGGQRLIQAVKGNVAVQRSLYKDIAEKPVLDERLVAEIRAYAAPGIAWTDASFSTQLSESWYGETP